MALRKITDFDWPMPDRVPKPKSLATLYRSLIASTALAAVMVAAVFWLNARSDSEDEWVRHSLEVHGQLAELMLEVQRAENSQRGYLLTGRNSDLQSYTTAADQIPAMLNRIGTLISDDPKQVEVLAQLSPLIAGTLKELQTGIEVRGGKDVKLTLPVADADASHQPMQQIAALSRAMQAEEERLLTGRRADATAASRQLQIGVAAAFLLICGIGGLIGFYTRRSFGELAAASLRLVRANEELLDQVSRRVQVESQLRQSQKMEAIGQLTGGIAHDFNNMLAVVLGSLELMQRRIKRGDFNIERFMDAARTATERASSLTHRLLAFARQQPLAPQPLDANRMIASMADLLRSTLGEQIRIENVAAAGLWATNADPHQLENTILNIALNARDAMPEGGKLTIETGNSFLDDNYCKQNPEVEPGQYVLVAITDTGTGMPPEVAAQAFDPFYTTKPTGKGTGLAASRALARMRRAAAGPDSCHSLGAGGGT